MTRGIDSMQRAGTAIRADPDRSRAVFGEVIDQTRRQGIRFRRIDRYIGELSTLQFVYAQSVLVADPQLPESIRQHRPQGFVRNAQAAFGKALDRAGQRVETVDPAVPV